MLDITVDHNVSGRSISGRSISGRSVSGRTVSGRPESDPDAGDVGASYTVCRPAGELDTLTVGQFRECLTELGTGGLLLVDLSGVPFLDSAGLGALIGGVRRAREAGGDVAVFGARSAVARLLHTTGFDRVAPVTETEQDAADALAEGR